MAVRLTEGRQNLRYGASTTIHVCYAAIPTCLSPGMAVFDGINVAIQYEQICASQVYRDLIFPNLQG